MAFFLYKYLYEGGGCKKSEITRVSGYLPTGKQAEMEVAWISIQTNPWKQKCRGGGCNEI